MSKIIDAQDALDAAPVSPAAQRPGGNGATISADRGEWLSSPKSEFRLR